MKVLSLLFLLVPIVDAQLRYGNTPAYPKPWEVKFLRSKAGSAGKSGKSSNNLGIRKKTSRPTWKKRNNKPTARPTKRNRNKPTARPTRNKRNKKPTPKPNKKPNNIASKPDRPTKGK
jgi:hypothetical protein